MALSIVHLIGVPGSGKSRIIKMLARHPGWSPVSTSQVIREALSEGLVHGYTLDDHHRGVWLKDELLNPLMSARIKQICQNHPDVNIVTDDFPGSEGQALFALKLAKSLGRLAFFIEVHVHEEVSEKRTARRGKLASGKRLDDSPKVAKERYKKQFVALTEIGRFLNLGASGWHYQIDGNRNPIDVRKRILSIVSI